MLPSKKIQVALVVLIIGAGVLIAYKYRKNPETTYTKNDLAVATTSSAMVNNLTQMENGNSIIPGNSSSSSTTPETLTPADVLARDFFIQIVKTNQSGNKITADNADQFVSDYLKTAPLPIINKNSYTANDILITDSNEINIQNYQTAIMAVFTKYWPSGNAQNEMLILNETFSNNNPKALDGLSNIISIYENALKGSLSVAVPQKLATEHLAVINALSAYIQTLKMTQLAYTDSIDGMVGLGALLENRQNLIVSMANLRLSLINTVK